MGHIGFRDYENIKRLENWCEQRGLVITGDTWSNNDKIFISVPKESTSYAIFPIYTRGVKLAGGSVEELLCWTKGFDACMGYLNGLGMAKKIEQAEQKLAGKYVMEALQKESKKAKDE